MRREHVVGYEYLISSCAGKIFKRFSMNYFQYLYLDATYATTIGIFSGEIHEIEYEAL